MARSSWHSRLKFQCALRWKLLRSRRPMKLCSGCVPEGFTARRCWFLTRTSSRSRRVYNRDAEVTQIQTWISAFAGMTILAEGALIFALLGVGRICRSLQRLNQLAGEYFNLL